MDWNWDSTSHKRTQTKKSGIKKLDDGWVWHMASMGPGQYGRPQVGEVMEDDEYPCGFCSGTGEKPKGSKCSACKGKGTVAINPPAVTCAFCKGRGEEKPRSNVTCTACKGHGVIHVEEPIDICPHCQGTGKEPINKLVCIACRGKGVVTVKKEEEEPDELEEEREDVGSFAQEKSRIRKIKESPVGSASGSEREALKVVNELGSCDRVAVGRNMLHSASSNYAEMLCNSLAKKGLLMRNGLIYSITSDGERSLGSG